MPVQTIYWQDGKVKLIDQTKLPLKLVVSHISLSIFSVDETIPVPKSKNIIAYENNFLIN